MCFRELDKNRKVKVKLEHHMHILWVQFHPAACLFLTLSALSPLFSSPLFPHSYSFPPVIPPLFSSFYFFYFFFFPLSSSHSFRQHLFLERDERRMESIEADIYVVRIYPCSTGPASFIRRFLFTVYAMVNLRGRWNDKATWPVSP